MTTRNVISFTVSIITLIALLIPQQLSTSTPGSPGSSFIPFTEHIIDIDFDSAHSVFAIDIDGDEDVDFLGAALGDSEIAWWKNDGNLNFTKHIVDTEFSGAHDVYALDVDGDLDIDILGSGRQANAIAWWENDGNENFTKHLISTTFTFAHSVYALDVDSDGDIDVLGAAMEDDDISWWENDSNESFTEHIIDSYFSGAQHVSAEDMDGDGDIDVLGAAEFAGDIAWWENDGNEDFTKHVIDGDFNGAQSANPVDLDEDGDMDVLAAAAGADEFAWWENDGAMNFTKHSIMVGINSARTIYAADMDHDTDLDILGAAYASNTIAWFENDGNEIFDLHTITSDFGWAMEAFPSDIDRDGDIDILGAGYLIDTIAWWEQGTPLEQAFFPIVIKDSGPPDAPVLYEIANPEADNIYQVSWGIVAKTTGYSLEEDDNPGFSSPTTVYEGTGITTTQSVNVEGTYYYRVKASNDWGDSSWSNVISVVVTVVSQVVPEPGTWNCSTASATVRFSVAADSTSASNGYISISCGSKSIAGPVPIEGSSFVLAHTDGYTFISATFDAEDHASGSYGIRVSSSCWALGTMTCTP